MKRPDAAMNVSVCMATYNGARYLPAQMSSILSQLGSEDEVVVVDDASSDNSVELLRSLGDARIRIHRNERNLGHVGSFDRALSLARHEVLVMSDQDDVWLPERLARMKDGLREPGCWVLSSNTTFIDAEGRPTTYETEGVRSADSRRYLGNIAGIFTGRHCYYGCAMAMRREILPIILPMPTFVESHDLWIAMAGNAARANVHLDANTLARRLHGRNASVLSRPLRQKLWSRVVFLQSLLVILWRLLRQRHRSAECAAPSVSR